MSALVVRPLVPGDLAALAGHAAEVMARPYLADAQSLPSIASDPFAMAGLVDGRPIAAGGFADQGNGVAIAWAVFAEVEARVVLPLFRVFRDVLATAPFHWIEAQIPSDLPQAMRFDRLLGFQPLSDGARIMTPDGREFLRYVYHGR